MKIKKAVILAAGLGTRMRPMTRAIPKPMLPVVDKPIIDYIISEATESGIEEIVVIVNFQKEVIKKHCEEYDNVYFIHQKELLGTADALLQAQVFTHNEPFVLYYADEIVVSNDIPCTKQLINEFVSRGVDVMAAVETENSTAITEYNCVVFGEQVNEKTYQVKEIVEKPHNPLTNYTSIGRYVISPKIYKYIEEAKKVHALSNELVITTIFNDVAREGSFYGHLYEGTRYDIGSKEGWFKANVELKKTNAENIVFSLMYFIRFFLYKKINRSKRR